MTGRLGLQFRSIYFFFYFLQLFGRVIKASIAIDNGRAAEFIRRRNYFDKSKCYECGVSKTNSKATYSIFQLSAYLFCFAITNPTHGIKYVLLLILSTCRAVVPFSRMIVLFLHFIWDFWGGEKCLYNTCLTC